MSRTPVLSTRALNRATLARQLLLDRADDRRSRRGGNGCVLRLELLFADVLQFDLAEVDASPGTAPSPRSVTLLGFPAEGRFGV
nr:hypothetical protein [Streptomyces sp. DSM 41633]